MWKFLWAPETTQHVNLGSPEVHFRGNPRVSQWQSEYRQTPAQKAQATREDKWHKEPALKQLTVQLQRSVNPKIDGKCLACKWGAVGRWWHSLIYDSQRTRLAISCLVFFFLFMHYCKGAVDVAAWCSQLVCPALKSTMWKQSRTKKGRTCSQHFFFTLSTKKSHFYPRWLCSLNFLNIFVTNVTF